MEPSRWIKPWMAMAAAHLVLGPLLVGCGNERPADIVSLIPTDTYALVYVRSPAELEAKLRSVIAKVSDKAAAGFSLMDAFENGVIGNLVARRGDLVDLSRPFAIALEVLDRGGEARPYPSFIFGARDAKAAKAELERALAKEFEGLPKEWLPPPDQWRQATVSGDFVTLSLGPPRKAGGKIGRAHV